MIGIVVVTHGNIGDTLIEVAETIIGHHTDAVVSISIDLKKNADRLREKIAQGIKKADQGEGVLILTDMFGGTPSNLGYSFLEEGRVEVISGVNLPLLIKSASIRDTTDLGELARRLEAFGKKSITLASSVLKGNKRI